MGSKSTQFQPGNKQGKGRPKGARNKFAHAFIKDFANDWKDFGPQAIEKVRTNKPDAYVKTGAALIPKDIDVNVSGSLSVRVVNYADEENSD